MWLANSSPCSTSDAVENRCPISFASPLFVEGTFFSSKDLCFVNDTSDVDPTCAGSAGDCATLRRGVCALPPFKQARTLQPNYGTCPAVEAGAEGWPYDDYGWGVEGVAGMTSVQVIFFHRGKIRLS